LDNKELDKVHGISGCPPGRGSVIQFVCLALISGLIIKYVSIFSILIYMSKFLKVMYILFLSYKNIL
jgi:hypothetical protein